MPRVTFPPFILVREFQSAILVHVIGMIGVECAMLRDRVRAYLTESGLTSVVAIDYYGVGSALYVTDTHLGAVYDALTCGFPDMEVIYGR